jgi:hypothetical protein
MKSPGDVAILELAKQDGRGRRLAAGAEREKLLTAFAASGLTQQGFATREGINRFTLATWIRKKRLAAGEPTSRRSPQFIELGVPRVTGYSLEVVMGNGVVVRGSDGQQLAALVRGLR